MKASTYKRMRMAMGLSQSELADIIGVSLNYVQKLESGDRPISELQGLKMMDLFTKRLNGNDELFSLIRDILKHGES